MSPKDSYSQFVNNPLGAKVASTLGLPQPVALRRYTPGEALATGPVLVVGDSAGADQLATWLVDQHVDVRRDPGLKEKFSAILVVLDEANHPEDVSHPLRLAGGALRRLAACGRVVVVARDVESWESASPAYAATHRGITGATRSIAQEMRRGATANGILLAEGVSAASASAIGALRFLLSGRSAYVSGQFLRVGSDAGSTPTDPARPLEGKVAVVTGAARGIGASIIASLHRDGAQVVGVDVPAAGDQLATVVNRLNGTALQMDITAEDAGQRIIEHCRDRYGRLDVVVHNAGITRDKLLANMDPGRWDSVIAVNLASQLRMNEALLADRGDTVSEGLRIATLASTSGIAGNRGQSNYAMSKAGVMGLTQATAPALAATGGSINAVAPGFIETEMTAKIPVATREVARRLNSLRQGGRPEDVAETIAFLVSDEAAGINGQTLRVCGQAIMGA
ncbi:MAG: 3-oxoacyl-ACP reductase [Micrococcaceae bacterium]